MGSSKPRVETWIPLSDGPQVYTADGRLRDMSIEAAIRRIREAETEAGLRDDDRAQQHEVYEKTFHALEDVTPHDDDEGITVVTEWIVERIEESGERPDSRAVRRRAAEFCRDNGYEIGDNDWLGA